VDLDTVFSESIPLTEHSGTEYKDINDLKNNCDYDLSCFLKFKGGALDNVDEVEQSHNYKGQEVQETACPGMCCKCSDPSLSVLYSLHIVLTDSIEQSLHCASDSFLRINTFPVFMLT
jgi:hypothetical protein